MSLTPQRVIVYMFGSPGTRGAAGSLSESKIESKNLNDDQF